MNQRYHTVEQCSLLAALDRGSAGEHSRGLILQFSCLPERASGVEKLLELRAHAAEASRAPPGNAVGPPEIGVGGFRNRLLRLLRLPVGLHAGECAPGFVQLGYPPDPDLGVRLAAGALPDTAGQLIHVAEGAVVNHEDVSGHGSPRYEATGGGLSSQ